MKKFRNSYAAYMLLYSFYFMSTSLFTTLISVYLMGKHYSATQVSTLVSVAFFLSMVAQPFFGYINERFGIVKMTTLSLSVIIGGVLGFLWAPNLFWLTVFYGIVLVCLNGTAPMMEVFATQSPYAFGKIRVWGTIGYSVGVQIAGWVYHQFTPPSSLLYRFDHHCIESLLPKCGSNEEKRDSRRKGKTPCLYSSSSSQWTLSLLYHFDWLGFRCWKYWSYLYS